MKSSSDGSLERLINLGICQPSDIRAARAEAEKFASPEYSERLRRAEKLLGAAADATRIKMLLLLSRREMCVCHLEGALSLPQPTASHHLGILEQAGLLRRSRRGRWVFYGVQDTPALGLIRDLMGRGTG